MKNPVKLTPRRQGRIVFSLLGVFLLVGLVPLVLVSWKLIDSNREALKTTQQEFQLQLASSVAREVDSHVRGLRAQLYGLARLASAVVANGPGAENAVREVLAGVADDRMLHLRYSDLKRLNVDSRSADVPKEIEALFVAGFVKVAERLVAGQQPELDDVAVSNPVLVASRPPRAVVVLTAPVVAGGRFRGSIFAVADLQSVWDEVAKSHRGGHGLFAVDGSGRLFASANLLGAAPGETMTRSGIVKKFLDKPGRATETAPFLWREGGELESYMGSYSGTHEGWGVFVQARERDVYGPVYSMIANTVRWALVAISLAMLAAVVFAGTLSVPINRLAETSRKFAAGDYASRVNVRARNEIGELAETFNHMAEALEDHIGRLKRAVDENKALFRGTAQALTEAIDAKDPYTRGHSKRVNRYSVILATYYKLQKEEIDDIDVSSLLHDVGKIGVDDAILNKPGRLTDDEFELMKQHPVKGATIMAPISQMKKILPGLRHHHERWSGGGYPDGLRGEAIPLMARIIAVADSFDAMTTDRPYQAKMTFQAAVARINELKGVAFDERVVEAFNRAFLAAEFQEPAGAERAAEEPVSA